MKTPLAEQYSAECGEADFYLVNQARLWLDRYSESVRQARYRHPDNVESFSGGVVVARASQAAAAITALTIAADAYLAERSARSVLRAKDTMGG